LGLQAGVDKLVTAIHNEGDALILCEQHAQGYDCSHSFLVCLDLVGADIMVDLQSAFQEVSLQSNRYVT
jgi:hypothetical protein